MNITSKFTGWKRKITRSWWRSWLRSSKARVPRPCVCVLCRHRAGILTPYPHHDSRLFPLPRRPLRLDLHDSFNAGSVVSKAAPCPILRALHQASLHRIAMNVTQLLDALARAPHIEVVIPRQPQQTTLGRAQTPRHILLEDR